MKCDQEKKGVVLMFIMLLKFIEAIETIHVEIVMTVNIHRESTE